MSNIKVFIADDVNEEKLSPLRQAGFILEKKIGLSAEELSVALRDADALVVRSETKVTAGLMDQAEKLRVIGRAGVGVDNIDVRAATERGIVVMNAPDGNTITTAEHTIALLVSMARKVPQAHAELQSGIWDKKKFVGVELRGKTLGIIGLGRIGRVVSRIAQGFEMNVLAFDPFISTEQAKDYGIALGSLDEIFAEADFLTVHTPLTDETRGIIGAAAFAKMKKGVHIINCARGGLVDEKALLKAIEDGTVAGAALDVFGEEPLPAGSPLLNDPKIITTPHLGASTKEAQEGVALTVAEQIRDYLLTGALRGAVNAPSLAAKDLEALAGYIELAEKLGRFQAQVMEETALREVRIEYTGDLAERDCSPVTRAFLAGLLRNVSARVNVVNAMMIAEERGIKVTTGYTQRRDSSSSDIQATVRAKNSEQSVSGSVFAGDKGRITEINTFKIEAVPTGHLLVTKNNDVPGVVGKIGTLLGENNVNIGQFYLGRQEKGGQAMAVIEIDSPMEEDVLNQLRDFEAVISAKQVRL